MSAEANTRAARAIIGELARAGIANAIVSPGSRSTPLVLAIAATRGIRPHVITDERSAAFFALGLARETRMPVALVCTSGTAVANYLPAVVEASFSNVPLVVLSADRPPELRECGANQTILQPGIFGSHVRASIDLLPPSEGVELEAWLRGTVARTIATAQEMRGPVHLNIPFREPLIDPTAEGEKRGDPTPPTPWVRIHPSEHSPSDATLEDLARALESVTEGIIVCGPETGGRTAATQIARLGAALGWPIIADPLSGLRFGSHDRSHVIDAYDLLLRDAEFCAEHHPRAIFQIGRLPASKALERFLTPDTDVGPSSDPVDDLPGRTLHMTVACGNPWPDFLHRSTDLVAGNAGEICERLAAKISNSSGRTDVSRWASSWANASQAVRKALDELLTRGEGDGVEGAIFPMIVDALPEHAALHVGNSMPVRDADTFLASSEQDLDILANRGASGIDGVLSTALGAAAAGQRPTALVVGDLSFLHDIGGLQIAAREKIRLLVVVVMNDGGGIFSFLPQASLGAPFERFFGTPHGLDPAGAVKASGARWISLDQPDDHFQTEVRRALSTDGLTVIGLRFDRATNARQQRTLISAAIDRGLRPAKQETKKQ